MKTVHKKYRLKAADGFTLTELLVAMVVLAVGCMAVISMQAAGMNAGDRAGSLSVATFLAESQAEWLQTMTLENVQMFNPGAETLSWDGSVCPASASPSQCFTRTTNIVCFTPTTRSCEVSITVAWQASDGQHSLVYDTMVSAFGF